MSISWNSIANIRSLKVINANDRNPSIDVFRAIAIVSVVLFHFNTFLPYGSLGVDLFFVISGLLIGRILVRALKEGKSINFFKFILQRGFKIWPSYYTLIFLGNIFVYYVYRSIAPDQFIPFSDLKRYVFFYQNYTGAPHHWCFDQIWTLCVEEHFYILLPVLFILIQRFFGKKEILFLVVGATIVAGILFKYLSLYYTTSKDTSSGTQYRIDALAWGVLLSLIIEYFPEILKRSKHHYLIFFVGVLLFATTVSIDVNTTSEIFTKVVLHSVIPFSFFLMIASSYHANLSGLKYFRLIAYYSYNWYLWHQIVKFGIVDVFGFTALGLIVYIIVSFAVAVFFTVFIEEFFLSKRKFVVDALFKSDTAPAKVIL